MRCHALRLFALLLGLLAAASAQPASPAPAAQAPAAQAPAAQAPAAGSAALPGAKASESQETKIQVNFLNPCRPAPADVEEMARALARVKENPRFSFDFEISRGVTTLTEAEARAAGVPAGAANTPSAWVRIQREFPDKAPLTDVQYSMSVDAGEASESLAMHLRDSREVLQIWISDAVKGSAAEAVKADTPPERIRIERFGKASIVLARCGGMDQSSYEPLFQSAGEILRKYRTAMAVKSVVPAELARLPAARKSLGKASGSKESRGKESKAAGANP
jgi:hypothetical protein